MVRKGNTGAWTPEVLIRGPEWDSEPVLATSLKMCLDKRTKPQMGCRLGTVGLSYVGSVPAVVTVGEREKMHVELVKRPRWEVVVEKANNHVKQKLKKLYTGDMKRN